MSNEKHPDAVPSRTLRERNAAPSFIIFTDLDGTLLDAKTYEWREAATALEQCREKRIPVIMVSSKTRAEIELLRRRLFLPSPFVSENGGGIFIPQESYQGFSDPPAASRDRGLWKISLGAEYKELVKHLKEMTKELGWKIRGFSDMTVEEISRRTHLDRNAAALAAMREFDEPFVVLDPPNPQTDLLGRAAAKRGLTVSSGGRFFHLQGRNDKGTAFEAIMSWYRKSHGKISSVALGDSPNDFPMLKRADRPVLVRSEKDYPELKIQIPRLRVTREKGPKGWNSAVLCILGKKEEAGDV